MTKEEILQKEFANETYVNLTVYEQRKILNAMEEYAQYKVNELNKSDVIKSVCVCDEPEESMEDSYCGRCGKNIEIKGWQTVL